MKRLIIAAAALALTGGVALAQNDAPQGDYVNHAQNGASPAAEADLDLSVPDLGIDFGTTASTKSDSTKSDQESDGGSTQQLYPGAVGGR